MKKKIISFLLTVAMVVSLAAGMSINAAAEASIKNVIKNSNTSENNSETPVDEDFAALLKDSGVAQMPARSSYLDEPVHMYMDSGSGDGAYAYKTPDTKGRTVANIYQGVSVELVAIEGDWGCVSFYNSSNTKKAGWAYLENLSDEYPGKTIIFGEENLELCALGHGEYRSVQPELDWSKFNFVDTKTKYTVIAEPWCDEPCAGIVFDYQVTSRNGVKRAWGERDVYINGGDGWEYVGSFEVEDSLDAVRCELYFDEPRVIKAIASIATGASAENFVFRQAVECMYCKIN